MNNHQESHSVESLERLKQLFVAHFAECGEGARHMALSSECRLDLTTFTRIVSVWIDYLRQYQKKSKIKKKKEAVVVVVAASAEEESIGGEVGEIASQQQQPTAALCTANGYHSKRKQFLKHGDELTTTAVAMMSAASSGAGAGVVVATTRRHDSSSQSSSSMPSVSVSLSDRDDLDGDYDCVDDDDDDDDDCCYGENEGDDDVMEAPDHDDNGNDNDDDDENNVLNLSSENRQQKQLISSFKQQLHAAEEMNVQLVVECDELSQRVHELTRLKQSLCGKLDTNRDECEGLRALVEHSRRTCVQLDEENKRLSALVGHYEAKIGENECDMSAMAARLESKHEEVAHMAAKLAETNVRHALFVYFLFLFLSFNYSMLQF